MGRLKDQVTDTGYPFRPGYKAVGPSQMAALAVAVKAATLRSRVLAHISQATLPPTADEIAADLGETVLAVRPRVSELNRQGEICAADCRGRNTSGMTATRWIVAPPLPNEQGDAR